MSDLCPKRPLGKVVVVTGAARGQGAAQGSLAVGGDLLPQEGTGDPAAGRPVNTAAK
ncbi:hypothetical protein [Streptomyces kanamyceticus]|uniref:hypothetical protein n=1 Tax=Streptomyces kanamyceticus TaxID=1967 RepID=UPI0037DC55B4